MMHCQLLQSHSCEGRALLPTLVAMALLLLANIVKIMTLFVNKRNHSMITFVLNQPNPLSLSEPHIRSTVNGVESKAGLKTYIVFRVALIAF